ncbi:hypothetical protein VHUM_02449 [Vanrija humicola]|uniref:Zinc-finger domain-containing protein n=1 Tax=Vanrija humicola TaxID=5417 RepID=A0A7D8UZ21_VANHU|nr:hypothetical protein VHUM_02449 [Vanrija humicola]
MASDTIPALTGGETAPTSQALSSPSLSPPPPVKRKVPATDAPSAPAKTKKAKPAAEASDAQTTPHERGTYCHQFGVRLTYPDVLRCTRLRKYTKATPARACNLAWCLRDLKKRYGLDPDTIRNSKAGPEDGTVHDTTKEYVFACPCCLEECQNATCRKKKGLEPLGDIVKLAAKAGVSALDLVSKTDADGPRPQGKARTSVVVDLSGELSDLSDLEQPKPKAKKARPSGAKDASTPKGKDAKGKDAKGKTEVKKEAKPKEKKPPAPKPVVEKPVDPPTFEKVDTRLSQEEAEQRMYLREFVFRFRGLLGIPDRNLGPLDDFDRPLSEASVRLLAGAMIDLIREEREAVWDEDTVDLVQNSREELRYYADLARFASIFNNLSEPLQLELPPAPETAQERNDRAMRALLDLGDDEAVPGWTDTAPSRRAAASRVPQASEVVRMIIALINSAINSPKIRAEMDPGVFDFEARQRNFKQLKEEKSRWDDEKKKIGQERVLAKSAAQTKVVRAKSDKATHDHNMRNHLLNVNLRAVLARKNMRFEPIGTDLDGRVYYFMTPRVLEENDRRAPTGWASGLLVWGRGVESETANGAAADELPPMVERWTHFGKSETARQLSKWLAWRFRRHVETMAPATKTKTPKKKKSVDAGTPSRPGAGSRKGSLLGVVIPRSKSSASTPNGVKHEDDEGYAPSAETIKEQGAALTQRIDEVAEWLAVLEWKGLGEI